MKNYLLISITIFCALITGFLLGRYTSDSGRYFFKFNGNNSSLFDTKTGDLYQVDSEGAYIINYKDSFDNPKKK